MSLVFALKMLSDICFYFTFANFFSYLFNGNNVLITTPIMAISAFLSAAFKERGSIKYVPLLLMLSCFFVVPMSLANIIVLMPPIFYIIYNVYEINKFKTNFIYSDIFFLYLKIAGPFIALFLFYVNKNTEQNSIPYVFIFLVCSVILMRMLRQDESALNKFSFKLMAIVPILIALFLGFILSSKTFFGLFKTALGFVYLKLVVPVLMVILTAISYIISPLFNLFKIIFKYEPTVDNSSEKVYNTENFNDILNSKSGSIEVLKVLITIVFIGLLIFFMVKLFRRLFKRENGYASNKGVIEERIPIDENEKPSDKIKSRKVNKVRLIFKKFMALCEKSGLPSKKSMTSLDYEKFYIEEFNKDEIIKDIRSVYLDVRYGEKEINSEDYKRLKKLFGELKK